MKTSLTHWTGFIAPQLCVFEANVREWTISPSSVLNRAPCCLKCWDYCSPLPTHYWLSTQLPSLEASVGLFRADSAFWFLSPSLPSLIFWIGSSRSEVAGLPASQRPREPLEKYQSKCCPRNLPEGSLCLCRSCRHCPSGASLGPRPWIAPEVEEEEMWPFCSPFNLGCPHKAHLLLPTQPPFLFSINFPLS